MHLSIEGHQRVASGEKAMFSFSKITQLTPNAIQCSLSLQFITPGSQGTCVVYASSNTGTGVQAVDVTCPVHLSSQMVTINREEEKLPLRGQLPLSVCLPGHWPMGMLDATI